MLHTAHLPQYLTGLAATLVGAATTDAVGSMLPLALGASFTLICTVDVVRRMRADARQRRVPSKSPANRDRA